MQSNKDNLNNLNSDQLSTVVKAKDLASVVVAEVLVPGIETPRWRRKARFSNTKKIARTADSLADNCGHFGKLNHRKDGECFARDILH